MSRARRCNELISRAQRILLNDLYTNTHKPIPEIAELTLLSAEKIKMMTADLERPVRSPPMTDRERTRLLMQW